ncbi:MAG: AAA family ATPase [Candidatus Omnitrophica bacterium]|nr:AAA family ATPase [Candidatus Omnitrophota bacterium]
MYEAYWGFTEKPFENTPDPRFLYHSPQHEEGLSRLLYVVSEGKGAGLLTGVFGCGKTLLGRTLFKELDRDIYKTAFIANPFLTYTELLMHIAYNLGARDLPQNKQDVLVNVILERLGEILENNLRDGKKTVVVIDEAHVIVDRNVWEELRLLLNFQRDNQFMLTLLILGQPELREIIESNKQFSQRLAVKFHLGPLNEKETEEYIRHRLNVAGRSDPLFAPGIAALIFKKSGGIPRRINHICDLALFAGFGKNAVLIDEQIINEVSFDREDNQ